MLLQDEGTISIAVTAWLPNGHPAFDAGRATISTIPSHIKFQGNDKLGRGLIASVPAGAHNALRFSYFDTQAAGNFTSTTNLNPWNTFFNSGDYMATYYRLRDFKMSFDFLTWPYPTARRRFRLKTLWQVQYVKLDSTFNAPVSIIDTTAATGSKSIILPTLGLGVTQYLNNFVRVEANASGFAIPHHSSLGDVDGDIAFKFGRIEVRAGARFFHFKTSAAGDFYMKGNLAGGFGGIRLYLR